MTRGIASGKALTVNPLKVSQPIGASLAFLGLRDCMPLEHGARGCTSFNKLFFMRHFAEPIPLQTTAMDMVTTVIGADENVVEALHTIAVTNHPQVIGLITTGLTETQGADIPRTIRMFRQLHPEHDAVAVVPVNATDTLGCLETGFALAVEAMVDTLVLARSAAVHRPWQVNILASAMLTPGDVEALKDWVESYGLTAVMLPDLADSMDGHLIPEGFSTLTYGGSPIEHIANMGESVASLVIGPSLAKAADALKSKTGVPDYRFAGLSNLEDCDAFNQVLAKLSGRPVSPKQQRGRDQLLDALVDCNFHFSDTPVAIAADADMLASLTRLLHGLGAKVVAAVVPAQATCLSDLPIDAVTVGDLEDLEDQATAHGAQLLITNSHGTEIAKRLKIPLLRAGFPLYDEVGAHARCRIGYGGIRQTIFDMANLLQSHHQEIQPYRSIYWQGTPREQEVSA